MDFEFLYPWSSTLKPRLRVTCNAGELARGQLAEVHFWKFRKCFHTSQTAKTFSSFTVISLVDAREGSFPFRSRFEKVLKFCPLAEKRGRLEGVRERGFNPEFQAPNFGDELWIINLEPSTQNQHYTPSPLNPWILITTAWEIGPETSMRIVNKSPLEWTGAQSVFQMCAQRLHRYTLLLLLPRPIRTALAPVHIVTIVTTANQNSACTGTHCYYCYHGQSESALHCYYCYHGQSESALKNGRAQDWTPDPKFHTIDPKALALNAWPSTLDPQPHSVIPEPQLPITFPEI
jgi:hypothetical protein